MCHIFGCMGLLTSKRITAVIFLCVEKLAQNCAVCPSPCHLPPSPACRPFLLPKVWAVLPGGRCGSPSTEQLSIMTQRVCPRDRCPFRTALKGRFKHQCIWLQNKLAWNITGHATKLALSCGGLLGASRGPGYVSRKWPPLRWGMAALCSQRDTG